MVVEAKVTIEHKGLLGGVRAGLLGGKTAGAAGGLGKLVGGLGLITGALAVLTTGVLKLVETATQFSGIFKGVMSGIQKTIALLLKPIGDILGVALMPILFLLKPIAMFFNAMMRPYIARAMLAMRTGQMLMQSGEGEKAAKAFGLGFRFLVEPLIQAFLPSTERLKDLDTTLGTMMGSVSDLVMGSEDYIISTSRIIKQMEDAGLVTGHLGDAFVMAATKTKTFNTLLGKGMTRTDVFGSLLFATIDKIYFKGADFEKNFPTAIGNGLSRAQALAEAWAEGMGELKMPEGVIIKIPDEIEYEEIPYGTVTTAELNAKGVSP